MENAFVLTHLDDNGIATLTLNRPEYHNAFDENIISELNKQLEILANNRAVKSLLLTANGKNFSAGADLAWMKKMINYAESENLHDALQLVKLLKNLFSFPKPTIALTKGMAMGGGIGLLACCDIVIAEEAARFCFSEVKLGLVPATIAPYIVRAIGLSATKYYFLTANNFSASEAKDLGLVHEVTSLSNLVAQGQKTANQLLKNGPNALTTIKALLSNINPLSEDLLQETARMIARIRCSKEAQEGLTAFFEKREPLWYEER